MSTFLKLYIFKKNFFFLEKGPSTHFWVSYILNIYFYFVFKTVPVSQRKCLPFCTKNILIKIQQLCFSLESRDTCFSFYAYLNNIVIKLTVLIGYKARNAQKYFKVLAGTNGLETMLFSSYVKEGCMGRKKLTTEEKAKVVAAVWGTELIQFLAALAILHQDDLKIRMNCTRTI